MAEKIKKNNCPPHHFLLNNDNHGVCQKCGLSKQFMHPWDTIKFTQAPKLPASEKYETNNIKW